MKRVVVIGSMTVDIAVKSGAFKTMRSHEVEGGVALCEVYGGKTEVEKLMMTIGGGGINVAMGLKKLGLVTRVVGRIGKDMMGQILKNEMNSLGLDASWVQEDGGTTAVSVVLVAADGGRSILTYRVRGEEIDGRKIDWPSLVAADWWQVTGSLESMDLLEDLVIMAKKNRVRIGLNPGKSELRERDRLSKLIPKLDLLTMNKMEAVEYWGESFDLTDEKQLAKRFVDQGVKMVAITDGMRGAGIADKDRWVRSKAFAVTAVDDTGAGDAFCSGIVCGILKGVDMEVALKMGLANGGSEVTKLGAKDGLLDELEMKKWLKRKLLVIEEKL